MLTLTCNSNGGQPVSLENMRAVRALCDRLGTLLIVDACRFAENAWFIKQRESEHRGRSVQQLVRDIFDLCDGVAMSTRKDGLCNCGGLLLLRDDDLFRKAGALCVMTEGFQMSYGSLPGRDLEAIAVGLHEVMDESSLQSRIESIADLARRLAEEGVPVVQSCGGHCVLIDAESFCPHLARSQQPAHALACALYEHSGIRASRIGSVLKRGAGQPMELVRLAIPRRTYTQAHLEYVAHSIIELHRLASAIRSPGMPPQAPVTVVCEEPEFQAA
jgi:tryptophanase